MIKKAFGMLAKLGKKLSKLPKQLLQGPKIIASVLGRVGRKTALLPLNTFSGKMLFVTLYLLVIAAASGLLYRVGDTDRAWSVFLHSGVGAAITGTTFLVSYPLDTSGYIEGFLVRLGVRQRMRMSTTRWAIVIGVFIGVTLAIAVEYALWQVRGSGLGLVVIVSQRELLWPDWIFAPVFVGALLVGIVLQLYVSRRKTRSMLSEDLMITDVIENDVREVILRNTGEDVVSVLDAKITDAEGGKYALNADLRFRPGQEVSVTLPEEFVLEIESDESPVGGFYERHITSIYSKTGATYVLNRE